MNEPTLKTIVVDDERLARREMERLLVPYPQIELVGEAGTVAEAVALVNEREPDLVFLDIQLVGETGFELLEKVEVTFHLVFVTAFDEYALRAFDVNAMDYLLKPVNPKRLAKTVERILQARQVASGQVREPVQRLKYDDTLFERVNDSLKVLKLKDIAAITAEGDYTRIHTADGAASLVTRSLKKWDALLPETDFMRIHRSAIVNIHRVRRIEKYFQNTHRVYIESLPAPLEMSRRYASQLKKQAKML